MQSEKKLKEKWILSCLRVKIFFAKLSGLELLKVGSFLSLKNTWFSFFKTTLGFCKFVKSQYACFTKELPPFPLFCFSNLALLSQKLGQAYWLALGVYGHEIIQVWAIWNYWNTEKWLRPKQKLYTILRRVLHLKWWNTLFKIKNSF